MQRNGIGLNRAVVGLVLACGVAGASAQTVISTAIEFDTLVRAMPGGSFVLANDIDMSSVTYVPIGDTTTPFTGTLDGDGYALQNLTIGSCPAAAGDDVIGLFGATQGATITDLHLESVDISGDESVGALAGLLQESDVTGCSVTGSVQGRQQVGGMFGLVAESEVIGSWTDVSVSTCNVEGEFGKWHGGLAGHIHPHPQPGNSTLGSGSIVRQCHTSGKVSGYWSVGGFAGNIHGSLVEDCFSQSGVVASRALAGGFTGYIQMEPSLDTIIRDSWSSGNVETVQVAAVLSEFWSLFGFINPGDGGFIGFAEGLVETLPAGDASRVLVQSCRSYGSVTSKERSTLAFPTSGGFIGWQDPGSVISGCVATGDVSSGMTVGGFVGWGEGRIEDSSAHGDTNAISNVGGFIGQMQVDTINDFGQFEGVIIDSKAFGNVYSSGTDASGLSNLPSLTSTAGGFAGYLFPDTVIEDCEAFGMVEALGRWSGGFAGHVSSGDELTRCVSFGPVIAHDGVSGGLLARYRNIGSGSLVVTDCYTVSDVLYVGPSGAAFQDQIGGFAGSTELGPTIVNAYSNGLVDASGSTVGGFIGQITGTPAITSSYWDTEASGQATSAGGVGLTTSQMKSQSSYVGWDFSNVWQMINSVTYPSLR